MSEIHRVPAGDVAWIGNRVVRALACLAFVIAACATALADDAVPPPGGAAPVTPAPPPGAPAGTQPTAAADDAAERETPLPPEPEQWSLVPETVVVKPAPAPKPAKGKAPKGPEGLLRGCLCPPHPCLSPFWWETDLRLHLRTFYFERHNVDASIDQAWAGGGWLQYTSGWFRDFFQIGATGYTSQPIYAPEDRDGTTLLAPGQEPITVLGQAYARLRWREYAMLTVYRQSVNDGYIGPQDNRMIPNTFEGVTLRGKLCNLAYHVGYLWEMKPRNRDEFIPMSEQAGVPGSDEGLWHGSLTWKPNEHWEIFAGDYYTPDVFNTAFGYAKYVRPLTCCSEIHVGAQYTDQRSVGAELLGSFATWNGGLGARVVWDTGLTLGAAFHATGEDANIRSPYGTWPGWLSLIETDFNRAGEKAFGVGLKYDFSKNPCLACPPGLLVVFAYAYGADRINPATGAGLPDTQEFDFDVTYDVRRVKGLQFRLRNAYVTAGGPDTGWQVRFIVNWEIDLL